MDISLFTTENSSANETSAINKIYHFQHKSNNIIDIQA